ncbi:Uma2 family endonuclease [Nonomuraea endophytica]|uniref:Uma2 family endonuclease n=1 Tax=Nonomuraea endophytica TaxID=714136 RepID=A0A7W7ZWG4_9ACTN|nr:Uma2 family endonuclease [Nonomuraea endophytica]MBB5075059.1 Uma2 family endonuclease [Nonomuraea endophytica]
MTATTDRPRDVLANWPHPPDGGWKADDLDLLPQDGPDGELDLFKHVELIDGTLILRSPQRRFHERVVQKLAYALRQQAPESLAVATRMDIKIGKRQRTCPDIVVIDTAADSHNATSYPPEAVHLVVEVVSPESEYRDREVKPRIYADAGIKHFWLVEEEEGKPVILSYVLDEVTHFYRADATHHGRLTAKSPFPVEVDFADLLR